MRLLKKYPNRRLYDTQDSVYVTLEDVRQMVLANESIKVVDSKSDADLTRSVLLQIIAEQEGEGHEPLLTNRVLQQLIRFYGDSMQGLLSRYIEQSVMIFLQQQELYQRRMRDVLSASPIKLVQKIADQNISFWRNLVRGEAGGDGRNRELHFDERTGLPQLPETLPDAFPDTPLETPLHSTLDVPLDEPLEATRGKPPNALPSELPPEAASGEAPAWPTETGDGAEEGTGVPATAPADPAAPDVPDAPQQSWPDGLEGLPDPAEDGASGGDPTPGKSGSGGA